MSAEMPATTYDGIYKGPSKAVQVVSTSSAVDQVLKLRVNLSTSTYLFAIGLFSIMREPQLIHAAPNLVSPWTLDMQCQPCLSIGAIGPMCFAHPLNNAWLDDLPWRPK